VSRLERVVHGASRSPWSAGTTSSASSPPTSRWAASSAPAR